MKRISFFFALTLLIMSFGLANAQVHEISLDHTVGYYNDGGVDKIASGGLVEFHLRVTNNGTPSCYYAPSGAFIISSSDGAEWGGTTIVKPTIYNKELFPGIFANVTVNGLFSSYFNYTGTPNTGVGADTVGFAGVAFDTDIGFFEGMDTVTWILQIHPTLASNGSTICLDQAGQAISGFEWAWNVLARPGETCLGSNLIPGWAGPFCFEVGTPPDLPPVFDVLPTTKTGSHCQVQTFNFTYHDPDPLQGTDNTITPTASFGTITNVTNTGATWSYTGTLADVGAPLPLVITLKEADVVDVTNGNVNVVLTNTAPQFTAGCGGTVFGQNGVLKAYPMAGADACTGDPMTMFVVDQGGITGTVAFNGTTLEITGTPLANSGPYDVIVGITDGVDAGTECTVHVELSDGAAYKVELEKTHGTIQGTFANVTIDLTKSLPDFGGFNFLVAYDASALTFQGATPGEVLDRCGWEYFTYRYGADGNCSGGCPSGLVRIVGIAETNNGPNHPVEGCDPVGVLANLSFLVSNDRTLECQYVPIRFFWIECGDNTISNAAGTLLYLASTVKEYPGDGANLMDLYTAVFPSFIGPEAYCYDGDKADIQQDIDFVNGGIDIVCADSIDARGDLNLDGLAYTIADAVMYSNYFVDGLTALVFITEVNQYGYVPGYAGSIAASDVNADGLALTVADLVYLIRVVVGDAQPYPKVNPQASLYVGESLTVDGQMGGAFIVIAGDHTPTLLANNMEMKSSFDGENTRVLVWSQTGESFTGEFLGNVGTVISAELATAEGAMVNATKLIPTNFGLAQNYPNPFNPTTKIELSLPVASDFTITIYAVTGQVVDQISGSGEAGYHTVEWDASNNASGVYFYKLTAGNFTDTKKMVLLK